MLILEIRFQNQIINKPSTINQDPLNPVNRQSIPNRLFSLQMHPKQEHCPRRIPKRFNKKILKNKIRKKKSKKNPIKPSHKNLSRVKNNHHKSRLSKTQKFKIKLRNKKSKKSLNNCPKSTSTRTSNPKSMKSSLDKLRCKAHLPRKFLSKNESRFFHGTYGKRLT